VTALEAVILAGGRGSRMGGTAKPVLELGGRTLLERTVDAALAVGCAEVTVVGPRWIDRLGVRWVREHPPFGGPVAGLAAALPHVVAEWVLVLPADLVSPDRATAALVEVPRQTDGACLHDDEGHPQWLTGVYRTAALRARLADFPEGVEGLSMKRVVGDLQLGRVSAGADAAADIDTWEHLREAHRRLGTGTETIVSEASRTLPPEALDEWAAALREHFGLSEEDLPIALILDLARDVANGVARPAAPFSAFVAGLVAGRSGGSPDQVRGAVAEISRLAGDWPTR
jgi:molybdopterin-guanine dinucleotide biosynthesis protein A